MKGKKILLAEDDENFGLVLNDYLELQEFDVTWVKDGAAAMEAYQPGRFDLCILDVMMPRLDGFSVARNIRSADKSQPIIFLTARSMKEDILKGYQLGADDYITKPFDSEVLHYKINAVLQRATKTTSKAALEQEVKIGRYNFHPKFRTLELSGEQRMLSPKEAALLQILYQYRNDLLPRSVALQKVWNDDNYFTGRSMDVYVAKLRKYLKSDPLIEIVNIHGEGFRLVMPD
jgi:DNA-binding response OmpR family regulator